jgi:HPt (histidine-containing phosphotransfer) domain-containing protein
MRLETSPRPSVSQLETSVAHPTPSIPSILPMSGSLSDFVRSRVHAEQFGGSPVIDETALEALRELGGDDEPGLLLELIELYLRDAEDRMRIMNDAQEGGDADTVGRVAHSLKSSSANMGALALSDMLRQVEETAAQTDANGLEQLVERCRGMYAEVDAAFRVLREMTTS